MKSKTIILGFPNQSRIVNEFDFQVPPNYILDKQTKLE